ncbi:MAG: putative polysaccharide biosynthesis protein [Acetivibrionales bacterium]
MKKRDSFLKGVLLLTAAGVIVKLLGFIYRVILTNLPGYGDEGNGIYGAGFQVYLVLYALSTTGFPAAIAKLVAEKTARRDWQGAHRVFKVSFWVLFSTGIIFSLLFFTCSKHIAMLISNPRTVYTMIAISPAIFFVSIMAVYRGYFQGLQDMSPQAYSQIIEQLGKTISTIGLAWFLMPYGSEIAAAGATFGTSIGAAIGAVYLWNLYNRKKAEIWMKIRKSRIRKKEDSAAKIIKNLIKIAFPISMGAVILTIANIIDLGTVMLQLKRAGFSSSNANELYGILTGKCYVLTHFPVSITIALATSLVPAIAGAMAVGDYKAAAVKISASLRLTVLISLPASAGMAILAEPILNMLFPASSEGAVLLALSSSTIIFIGLTQTLSGILQGLGKVYVPAVSLFMGAVAKLLINYILIPVPSINVKGAVYGTLVCYIISTLICMAALVKNFKLNLNLYNFIIKPVLATIVMGFGTYYTYYWISDVAGSSSIGTIASIAVSVFLFGMLILVMGGVSKNDVSALPFGKNVGRALNRTGLMR